MGVFISWAKLPTNRSCRSTDWRSSRICRSSRSAMTLKSWDTIPTSSEDRTRTLLA